MNKYVVDAVIEVPYRSRNKYEEDEETGRIRLDRVLYSAMGYPCEYGTIEETLAPDGDPLDILIISTEPSTPGCIVPARIVGYLDMSDGGKIDYKLISVIDCDPRHDGINNIEDIPEFTLKEIKNFFENYKNLQDIQVEVREFHGREEAIELYNESKIAYLNKKQKNG